MTKHYYNRLEQYECMQWDLTRAYIKHKALWQKKLCELCERPLTKKTRRQRQVWYCQSCNIEAFPPDQTDYIFDEYDCW